MLQTVMVSVIFLAALAYLSRLAYRSFQSRSCATGCGKCSNIDFEKIAEDLRRQKSLAQ